MKNDFYVYHDGELYHHGILGQKWGKRNGPPYPLDDSDYSAAERKFDTGKTSGSSDSKKTTRAERKAARQKEKEDTEWTGQYGNANDKTISDKEAQNFWKGLAAEYEKESGTENKSSNNSSNSDEQRRKTIEKNLQERRENTAKAAGLKDSSKLEYGMEEAYDTTVNYQLEIGGSLDSTSKEFRDNFNFFYELESNPKDIDEETKQKGKSFFSRHSK